MRYSLLSAALALASSVLAQTPGFDAISSPTQDQNVAAGSTLQIVWDPATYTGTVTITLLEGGSPSTLSLGPVVKAGIDNTAGKYSWAVPTTLASFATYGFSITLDSDPKTFQYSFPFHITGLSGSGSGSGSSSASGASTYPTSGMSTTTVKVGTGTAYTTSAPSTTVVSTTTKANSTTTVVSHSTAASNATLATTAKPSASKTSSGSSSATGSGASSQSSSAAAGNMVTGGFAVLGGLVLALAL